MAAMRKHKLSVVNSDGAEGRSEQPPPSALSAHTRRAAHLRVSTEMACPFFRAFMMLWLLMIPLVFARTMRGSVPYQGIQTRFSGRGPVLAL